MWPWLPPPTPTTTRLEQWVELTMEWVVIAPMMFGPNLELNYYFRFADALQLDWWFRLIDRAHDHPPNASTTEENWNWVLIGHPKKNNMIRHCSYSAADEHIWCGTRHMIVIALVVALLIVCCGRFGGANPTHWMRTRFSIGTSRIGTTAFKLLNECRLTGSALFLHQLTNDGLNRFGRLS